VPIDILKALGARVREERIKRGLSQEKFAELADVHRTYVGMIERGEKNISLRNLEKIAKALDLPLHSLLRFK
jgi:transcriptional regulator with XRE-family HTH domain